MTELKKIGCGGCQRSEILVMGPIERSVTGCVQVTMDRARRVICSLLPALWVLTAGHCLADSAIGCADRCCQTSVSATEDNGHGPSKDARTSEPSVRVLSRRLGTQTGWGGLLVPVAISAPGVSELEQASAPLAVSTEALGLAKCWQFHWRTASEPRAPSSVS